MMNVAVIFLTIFLPVIFADGDRLQTSAVVIPDNGGDCLSAHNALRALHKGTNGLVWDSYLATEAQKWADYLASIHVMEHSEGRNRKDQGENLGYFRKPVNKPLVSCTTVIRMWYAEIANYDFKKAARKPGKTIGHFTQLVWRASTKLGMGIATSVLNGHRYQLFVARYSPPGNVGGWYRANVKELISKSGPCSGKPCKHKGHCLDQYTSYECHCKAMNYGKHCEITRACKETWGGCRAFKAKICGNGSYKSYLKECLITCEKCKPKYQCKNIYPFWYCEKYKNMICTQSRHYKFCKKTCKKC